MQYVDEFGFEPMPERLTDAFEAVVRANTLVGFKLDSGYAKRAELEELQRLGYVTGLEFDYSGNAWGELSAKGGHYYDDRAAYERRKAEWEAERAAAEKGDKRHDWALAVGGAVIGSALTLGVQVLLGILQFG